MSTGPCAVDETREAKQTHESNIHIDTCYEGGVTECNYMFFPRRPIPCVARR